MITIVYFRSAKTGSTSIINTIQKSNMTYLYVKLEKDIKKISNKYDVIIVGVAANPNTELYAKIVDTIDKIKNKVSFAVVRNPYSKVRSACSYLKLESFTDKILNGEIDKHDPIHTHLIRSQTQALFLDGKQIPETLIRFEDLNNQIYDFFKKYEYELKLSQDNKSNSDKIKLSRDDIKIINDHFSEDFHNFNYEITQ